MAKTWKAWRPNEDRLIAARYADGVLASDIAEELGRTPEAVRTRAKELGVKHPRHNSKLAIAGFESRRGKSLADIAKNYSRRKLSRTDLAADIGIHYATLKRFLPAEIWDSWPRMTVGRQLSCEQRRA
ncbi:hypothetical protein CTT34_10100 [Vreelandella aquamarina]|uniref:Uncharacterized protein n=1 Tax=Vreelandella aquamarina TaxID=77097 RepID=A0A857GND3_9GAMM|nr:hypothetical protein CTT34_10100 [Halomonas meridiana]